MTVTTSTTSKRNGGNSSLAAAKSAAFDEYYTLWTTIEKEVNAYRDYDPDVFRDKAVLLPCDDPEWSNFAKFFALNFTRFGLKKLISTSYAPDSNLDLVSYHPTLFESDSPQFDETKTRTNGKKFVLTREDANGDGVINIDDLEWEYLEGDGDFRSAEVSALRDEADVILTNPPFSLGREFIRWVLDADKKFAIIGPNSFPTTKEIFPLFQSNQLWFGSTGNTSDMVFAVPKGTPIARADAEKAARLGHPPDENYDYTRMGNSCWYTNLEHGKRHEPMELMTQAENLKFNGKLVTKGGYREYDNFDALDIPVSNAIPSDYHGVMGVPVSYLDHYCPDQFDIVGITKTWFGAATKKYGKQTQISASGRRTTVGKLNDGGAIPVDEQPENKTVYEVDGQLYIQTYPRILIKPKATV